MHLFFIQNLKVKSQCKNQHKETLNTLVVTSGTTKGWF